MKKLIPAILVLLGLVAFMKCDPGSTNSDGYRSGFYYNLEDALKNPRDVWSLSLLGHYDSIPRVITSFQDMGHFSIMGSEIKEVPHWIGELEHLQTLGLSYNQINHVSPGISEMKSLYEVNLGNNRLDSLPTDVTFMSHCVTIFSMTTTCAISRRCFRHSTAVSGIWASARIPSMSRRKQKYDLGSCVQRFGLNGAGFANYGCGNHAIQISSIAVTDCNAGTSKANRLDPECSSRSYPLRA